MAGISTTLSPEALALLETIAGPESAGQYNVNYGGGLFDSYAAHPNNPVQITSGPNRGRNSTAAGKYQFLKGTWDDIAGRYGLSDFSPQSQDTAAWVLAQEEYKADTGRSLQADLAAGNVSQIPASLRNVWTSMPGGIEQGIGTNAFNDAYWRNMGLNLNSTPDLDALDMATAGTGPLARPAGGVASGVPQGTYSGNTDYMNALANRFANSTTDDTGTMPGWSQIANTLGPNAGPSVTPLANAPGIQYTAAGKPINPDNGFLMDPSDPRYPASLPAIGPTGGPTLNGAPRPAAAPATPTAAPKPGVGNLVGDIFGGLGDIINGAGANVKGLTDTVGDMGVAAGGAITNKINPLQAMAGVLAGRLPNNNLGQGIRAAMGFQNPNVGMTLGMAPNGGVMVQGVNGVMNSTSQNSKWWKDATGQGDGGDWRRGPAVDTMVDAHAPVEHFNGPVPVRGNSNSPGIPTPAAAIPVHPTKINEKRPLVQGIFQ